MKCKSELTVATKERDSGKENKLTIRHSMEEEACQRSGPRDAALFLGEMWKEMLQLRECSACPCKDAAGRNDLAAALERLVRELQ